MKKKAGKDGIVYSTNPDYRPQEEEADPLQELSPSAQTLYLVLERHKGGKMATVIENFKGSENLLEQLGKRLKSACGVGGSVKDGLIILQGDLRDKVAALLRKEGYVCKMKGG